MPRYHFNVQDGVSYQDHDGTELPNLRAARHEAIRVAGDMVKEDGDTLWDDRDWQLHVTDDTGLILFSIVISAFNAPATQSARRTSPLS